MNWHNSFIRKNEHGYNPYPAKSIADLRPGAKRPGAKRLGGELDLGRNDSDSHSLTVLTKNEFLYCSV